MGEEIARIATESAKTGEPMMKSLDYSYPGNGYERIIDEFLLGDSILVAPVLCKGEESRKVVFPQGTWCDVQGNTIIGPTVREVVADISCLPWYRKIDN